jgi:protein-S-isoprenylcysteine O-methyltransferase Ste14
MILFIIIWSLWFLSEILLNRLVRSSSSDSKNKDKGSIHIIWITIGIANLSGILCAVFLHCPMGIVFTYIGLLLIVTGMIIRFIAIRSLGRLFTVDVTIRKDHYIKKDGMYKIVRHPSYTGSLISFLGLGFSLNNWISTIIIITLVTAAMLYRIKIEEQLLIEQFGDEYKSYMKNTYRILPWVY